MSWPNKKNIHIFLSASDKDKIIAFDQIVERFINAKDTRDLEMWIALDLLTLLDKSNAK